ncbi:MAG: hypothetical protein Q7J73_09690 [Dehalococcoidales bacterium]|nr:hypothetical protein [Dehalococcoidales bacterium]
MVPEPACPVPSPEVAPGEWNFAAEPVKYIVEVTPASGQGGFRVSQLQAYPVELEIGDNVTISVVLLNTGIQPGIYTVALTLDNAVILEQDITIDSGASKKLELSVMPPLGEFVVIAGELTAGLKVVF